MPIALDQLYIEGGNALNGVVQISGAKNAALPILAAALLTKDAIVLRNVPRLKDVYTMIDLLSKLGTKARWITEHELELHTPSIKGHKAAYELVKTMRASILVLGPLLGRSGQASVSLPGGCAIGARPVDQHLQAVKQLGVKVELLDGYINAKAGAKGLTGGKIKFNVVTVTGTENAIMAAVLAKGDTVIENAACEPEVIDLVRFLKELGAKITGEGSSTLHITGVKALHGVDHYDIMPDRIEAGTYLIAGAITGGKVQIEHARASDMTSVIEHLQDMGVSVAASSGGSVLIVDATNNKLHSVPLISTAPYPAFPTDMQAQFMSLACKAKGDTMITENIFENRFMHVAELQRMGANITVKGNQALVHGNINFKGTHVMATDLRASASLVLAGLAAEGATYIDRIYHLDRGYENLTTKLQALGASVRRITG